GRCRRGRSPEGQGSVSRYAPVEGAEVFRKKSGLALPLGAVAAGVRDGERKRQQAATPPPALARGGTVATDSRPLSERVAPGPRFFCSRGGSLCCCSSCRRFFLPWSTWQWLSISPGQATSRQPWWLAPFSSSSPTTSTASSEMSQKNRSTYPYFHLFCRLLLPT